MKIGKWFVDVMGGELWMRRVELPNRFHFISVTDMDDACGSDNDGHPRYVIELNEVDLQLIPDKTIESAIKSCGWDGWGGPPRYNHTRADGPYEPCDECAKAVAAIAEMCHSYGAKAPLHSVSTNSETRGFRECRKESYLLSRDRDAYEQRMERTVNKMGSTAREFMQGDMMSALDRGVRADKPEARLMAKMYGVSEEKMDAIKGKPVPPVALSIRMQPVGAPGTVPSDDPLAYSMGFMAALSGRGMDGPREELAKAYLEGYKLGVGVKAGEEPMPEWAKGI